MRAVGDDYAVLMRLPLTLGEDSEPEPDLAVVRAEDAASRTRDPAAALLVIEVAGESLRFDRRSKAALYARAGIPEYLDREPRRGTSVVRRAGETLTAVSVPGVSVDVRALVP